MRANFHGVHCTVCAILHIFETSLSGFTIIEGMVRFHGPTAGGELSPAITLFSKPAVVPPAEVPRLSHRWKHLRWHEDRRHSGWTG